jgi:cholest-4-en-3-one 26-monooxygenase
MIAQDDPRHRQQRMMVQHHFTRSTTAAQRGDFGVLIGELINAVIDDGQMEVVDALAGQLPARLTARLMGFEESQWRDVKSWSERLMRVDMRERDGLLWDEFVNANMEFGAALGQSAQARFGCPHNDLISDWVNGTIDGEALSPAAILHETGLFIAGGAETTRTLISHGLRAFCDHPDQWEALAGDPSLVPGAVEEMLRWVTPLNNFFRRAMSDDHIGDQPVRRGDRVILLYPSANRDEGVFNDPFAFDITRSPNPHVAFGFGTHLCLGANFARTELNELFTQLPQRITNLRTITEPDVEDNIFARAVRSFTLGFDIR